MPAHRSVRMLLAAIAATAIPAALAAPRTFVASNGSDASPCSLALPCRTFTAALAATSPDGEVIVLDSAGYGAFATTSNVTITAPAGIYAGVTVGSGTGVSVASGTRLVLRGLTFNGQGSATTGIFASGAGTILEIERCALADFTQGAIDVRTGVTAVIRDSVVAGSAYGVSVSDSADVSIERLQATRNAQAGLSVSIGHAAVTDSVFTNNARGIAALPNIVGPAKIDIIRTVVTGSTVVAIQMATQNAGTVDFTVTDSLITGNAVGISAQAGNGLGAILGLLVNNTIADQLTGAGVFVSGDNTTVGLRGNHVVRNPTGVSRGAGTTVRSLVDNWITDNGTNVNGAAFSSVTPL